MSRIKDEEKILSNEFLNELRRIREEKNITLEEVAEKTNIKLDYVKAIEEGDLARLPGGIYNRAYIRSFSEFLGIDTKPFEKNVSEEEIFSPHKMSLEFGRDGQSVIPTGTIITVCFLFIILVYLIFFSGDSEKTAKQIAKADTSENVMHNNPLDFANADITGKNIEASIVALRPTNVKILDEDEDILADKNLKVNQAYIFQIGDGVDKLLLVKDPSTIEIYLNGYVIEDIKKLEQDDEYYILNSESFRKILDKNSK